MALIVATTLWLGGPSCSSHSDGVEVAVGVQTTATPTSFDTDLGYSIELDAAYLNVSSVELLPCAEVTVLEALGPSMARAHTPGSPTVLGEPHVIDLIGTLGLVEHVGTLLPPPGQYCGLHVMVGPADADALGLPLDVDMVGKSVHLAGTLTPSGGEPRTFVLESAVEAHVELAFAEPVALTLDAPLLGVVVGTDHVAWLDGVDFDAQDLATQRAALADHLIASLEAQLQP